MDTSHWLSSVPVKIQPNTLYKNHFSRPSKNRKIDFFSKGPKISYFLIHPPTDPKIGQEPKKLVSRPFQSVNNVTNQPKPSNSIFCLTDLQVAHRAQKSTFLRILGSLSLGSDCMTFQSRGDLSFELSRFSVL